MFKFKFQFNMLRSVIVLALTSSWAYGQTDVLTAQYNNDRTSANMDEGTLTASNVNAAQFGKLFSRAVDGPVYALPLVVTQFTLPSGAVRNLLIVATLNNSVYAFDADNPAQTEPYWHVNVGPPIITGELFLGPEIGIVATPVIDRTTNTIYLTAIIDKSGDVGSYIFALDLANGSLKYNSPQRAVLPLATGEQQTDATAWFQRAGLLLSNDAVYIGYVYVSDDALSIQHGFVQAFQANDLSNRLASWESSPNTPHGGIWQAGRGLAADRFGNLFVATADGEWNGTTDFGNSAVQLHSRTLAVESYFTPANWLALFQSDTDLGANGVTLLPNTHLALTGGKQGVVYLMDGTNLGGLENDPGPTPIGQSVRVHALGKAQNGLVPLQSFQASNGCGFTQCGQNLSTAFWPHKTHPYLFVWDKQDYLRAYPFDIGSERFKTADATVGKILPNSTGGVVVTSEDDEKDSGVVWAYTAALNPANDAVPGVLRAFDATDITKEIYNSDQNSARDSAGSFVKFLSPVVANGHVYVGNQSGSVGAYGLLCQTDQSHDLAVKNSRQTERSEEREAGGRTLRQPAGAAQDTETITFTNRSGKAIAGPFSVVLTDLPAGETVVNATGVTSCTAPAGSPWVAATGAPLWLQSGQSFSVQVTFSLTANQKARYNPLILAGTGGQ